MTIIIIIIIIIGRCAALDLPNNVESFNYVYGVNKCCTLYVTALQCKYDIVNVTMLLPVLVIRGVTNMPLSSRPTAS